MRLTILGGSGAWPTADQACSGYVLEHDGFRLLIDPGFGTLPVLLGHTPSPAIDAVIVSHGHPDHCADLIPLLRSRVLAGEPAVLPIHALPGALDALLAIDDPGMLDGGYTRHDIEPGTPFAIGPYTIDTALLPHFRPNVGMRVTAGDRSFVYTGDCGPSDRLVDLARDADVLLAEATYVESVPAKRAGNLTTAIDAGRQGAQAGVHHLVLTHLWPGTSRAASRDAAAGAFVGPIDVAARGLTINI